MPITPAYPVVFTDLLTVDGTTYRGGYCTVADVRQLFANMDNFSKMTGAAGVTLFETIIADVAQDLDRAFEVMYVVPITGTNATQHLNFMSKYMAAASVFELLAHNSEGSSDKHMTAAVSHHEKASQRLDDIVRGVTQLFDAVTKGGGERPLWPAGKAAQWNTDVDPDLPFVDPRGSAPLFGVRADPTYKDDRWII